VAARGFTKMKEKEKILMAMTLKKQKKRVNPQPNTQKGLHRAGRWKGGRRNPKRNERPSVCGTWGKESRSRPKTRPMSRGRRRLEGGEDLVKRGRGKRGSQASAIGKE